MELYLPRFDGLYLPADPSIAPADRLEVIFRRRYRDAAKAIGRRRNGDLIYPVLGGAEKLFMTQNSTIQTTAAPVKQPTGTAIRTMLQLASGTANKLTLVEWGISFDGVVATSVPIQCELFGTTVAATLSTALAATDVTAYNYPGAEASNIQYGTALSAFATAAGTEGTVANARNADIQQVPPTGGYVKQWPLGREFVVLVSQFLRQRVTAGVTVNAYGYVVWAE
jgi:hypothetical protein